MQRYLLAILSALTIAGCSPAHKESTVLVVIETSRGNITLELYPEAAPLTVSNFLAHVEAGHFNDTQFYRTVRPDNDRPEARIDVIQGGVDFDGLPEASPIAHERTDETRLTHRRGAISMARDEPGSATTEYFIVINDSFILDAGPHGRHPDGEGFAVFGYVVDGIEVAEDIWQSPVSDDGAPDGFETQWLTPAIEVMRIRTVGDDGGR